MLGVSVKRIGAGHIDDHDVLETLTCNAANAFSVGAPYRVNKPVSNDGRTQSEFS